MLLRASRPYSVEIECEERLPFSIRFARTPQDLLRAVEIRSSAFARHLPEFGMALREVERDDLRHDVLVLIAVRKIDGQVLGSMRLQPNINQPLRVEGEVALPEAYRGRRLVEFMRLGVENGNAGRMVMAALCKAAYEISSACSFDSIIAAGRRSTSEIYRSMQFDCLFDGEPVVLSYGQGMPHWIFALPVAEADHRWRTANHSLYGFMARTRHQDIEIDYERVHEAFW